MPPQPAPPPPDFAARYVELSGEKEALKRHYGVGREKVDRWIAEVIDSGTSETRIYELTDLPKGRPAEMLEERDLDPDHFQVQVLRINEWAVTTKGEDGEPQTNLNRQTRLNVVPREKAIRAARPDGWKRPKVKPPKKGEPQLVAICGDQHAPEHDREFHVKFLSWLRENQPSQIVILGDLLENADVSRWQDRAGEATAQESIDAGYMLLRDYIDAAPDAAVTWIEGNHDQRVETHTNQNARKVAGIHRAGEDEPVLSIPHLLRLDELGVEYIADYPLGKLRLTDNLAVIHGNIVKKGAGASALANLEKRGYSVVSGHTHRAGVVFKTVMDIDDQPSTLLAAETGTMKQIKPEVFDVAPDHQNAFVTATIWPDQQFHLEPAIYSAGFLRWRGERF